MGVLILIRQLLCPKNIILKVYLQKGQFSSLRWFFVNFLASAASVIQLNPCLHDIINICTSPFLKLTEYSIQYIYT